MSMVGCSQRAYQLNQKIHICHSVARKHDNAELFHRTLYDQQGPNLGHYENLRSLDLPLRVVAYIDGIHCGFSGGICESFQP